MHSFYTFFEVNSASRKEADRTYSAASCYLRLLKNWSKMVQRANAAQKFKSICSKKYSLHCKCLFGVQMQLLVGQGEGLPKRALYTLAAYGHRREELISRRFFWSESVHSAKDTLHVILEPRWCGAAGAEGGLCKRSQTQQPYPRPSYTIPTSPSRRADSQEMRAS